MVRQDRGAARRDEDLAGTDARAIGELHAVAVAADNGATIVDRHAGLLEIGDIDARQAGDLALLRLDETAPIEGDLRDAPAEAFGVRERIGETAGIDHQFFRHAAADDAGAPDTELLGDDHAGAVLRGDPRGPRASRAGTDDEEIAIVGRQRSWPFFFISSRTRAIMLMEIFCCQACMPDTSWFKKKGWAPT